MLITGAIMRAAQTYKVVIGLEQTWTRPYDRLIYFELKQASLADALDAITQADPRYVSRREASGTIRVFTKKDAPTLANVQVSRFTATEVFRRDLSSMLDQTREITDWLGKQGCSRSEVIMGNPWADDDKRITLDARRKTLREILDEIALRTERFYWSVTHFPENGASRISIRF